MRSISAIRIVAGMRHMLGTVCVGMAALLVSGCTTGSSSDDHRATKQAYITRADAICARVDRADRAIPTDTPLPEVLRETTDRLSRGVADLKALDRPAGHDQELNAWFHVLDQEVAALSRMQPAADAGDRDGLLRMFTSNQPLEHKIQRAARRFGFHDCAR
jgi:hypothetical protein